MSYYAVFKRTLQELIIELQSILESQRYDAPTILYTDLKTAEIFINACNEGAITEIMNTFSKFVIPLESYINSKDVQFFKRMDVCKGCLKIANEKCVCSTACGVKCKCAPKCFNCSEILRDLDSKTFNAIKYIVGQAAEDQDDPDKREDIEVIFKYISSLLAASKNYKKR